MRHERGNQTCGNHMCVMIAMRYLYAELVKENHNPTLLNTDHFIKAERKAQQDVQPRTARQIGLYLTNIANILNVNHLTKIRIHFQTSLPIVEAIDKLSNTAKQRRNTLLPKREVLQALAEIALKLDNDKDCIRMNIIKILLFTGFRLGEALSLPVNTLVIENMENSTATDNDTKIGLCYWPEKGAEPRIKWLLTDVGKLIKVTVEELTSLTQDARECANWLEKFPNKLNSKIKPNTLMDMQEVAQFVGVENGVEYCKNLNIKIIEAERSTGGYKKWYVHYKDLEKAILAKQWTKPMLRLPNGRTQKLSKSLCVVFFRQLSNRYPTIKWLVRPISETNISNFICGTKGIKNVFEYYKYQNIDGLPYKIRSHSFRHLLNTLANEGGLTDVELAWWFGRKSIKDNRSYDHRTAEQLTEKARQMMLSGEIIGSIANAARRLPMPEANEFVNTHVNAVHYTPYGLCTHDFAQNPCDKHLNCLSNCKEYHRTVGNYEERRNLKLLQKKTVIALTNAKQEMEEGAFGASALVTYNQDILDNIGKALAVDDYLSKKTSVDTE